jgi:protein SHQ1
LIMPLTPRFVLSQKPSEVIVTVFVPTVRITNIEVLLEDSTLHFYASPYLLKLNFAPHEFATDAQGIVSAQYNPSNQTVEIPLVKAQPNVEWPHLELTARLLQPQEIPKKWLHSVEKTNEEIQITEEDQAEQELDAVECPQHSSSFGYGFGNIFQNIFTDYCRSGLAQEMLQLPDPESTSPESRRELRIKKELEGFDPDRYLQDSDLQEDYLYPLVMDLIPFWEQEKAVSVDTTVDNGPQEKIENTHETGRTDGHDLGQQFQRQLNLNSLSATTTSRYFTSDEQLQLSTIPYPLIPKTLLGNHHFIWCGLLDLLVPYVYDHLTTMGEPTVESAWTITILSCGLSWLDPPQTLDEALVSLSRRMCIYPYWRNWEFAMKVWNHVLSILEQGIHSVIKSLLQVRNILEKSESFYVGNKLFVDPFLYWIQNLQFNDSKWLIESLKRELGRKEKLKDGLGLDLIRYENMLQDSSESESDSDDDSSDEGEDSDESNSDPESDLGEARDTAKVDDESNHNEGKETNVSSALLDSEVENANPSLLEVVGSHNAARATEKDEAFITEVDTQTNSKRGKSLIQEID